MKYYKAKKNIIDGKIYYGNLPYLFVLGYENEIEAYFQIYEYVELPNDSQVEEITLEEFNSFIEALSKKEEENRKSDYEKLLEQHNKIKNEKDLLLSTIAQQNIDNTGLQEQVKMLIQTITNMQLGGIN